MTPEPAVRDQEPRDRLGPVLRGVVRVAAALRPVALRLPAFPGSLAMASALNAAFAGADRDDWERLDGKVLAIRVPDAGLEFRFRVRAGEFLAVPRAYAPDVVISAGAAEFLDLVTRRVDADTLFFSRRLVIEGDTELGLFFKNRLDALEIPLRARSLPGPAAVLRAVGAAAGLRRPNILG